MGRQWRNWSGSVRCAPRELARPTSLDELARMVGAYGRAGRHVRVVGAGHSFTPLVQTDDVLLTLDGIQGIEAVDAERGTVRVLGGTQLKRLGDELLERGLAQENLGDIDVQSIAGAISTGTHGTGVGFGTLATQVAGLTLVTASGEVVECSEERNPDVFKAAQVSLGALGVLAAVTLRVVPARRLRFQARRETLEHCLSHLEEYKRENSHFEFFWFPYGKWVQVKFLNETEAAAKGANAWGTFNKIVMENGLFWVLSEMSRLAPAAAPGISRLSGWGISSVDETDFSHRLFATMRVVRFQEMEYNVPVESFPAVLEEVRACIEQRRFRVNFPVECRFVRGDDIWLSPAYQRDSAYIAVHMYQGMEHAPYFDAVEAIFARYQGRPHWGKMHSRTAAQLAALYPRWDDFRRSRAALDPQGVFLNDYLRGLFDVEAPVTLHR
ncbi:MAG TPA: D-arabinono-1,4-lactone oxidase [Ktedonobacterales bacterium]|nr:D-arabinono-1,4-lactone oxidase [Ktedonobacterales bacterium]